MSNSLTTQEFLRLFNEGIEDYSRKVASEQPEVPLINQIKTLQLRQRETTDMIIDTGNLSAIKDCVKVERLISKCMQCVETLEDSDNLQSEGYHEISAILLDILEILERLRKLTY